MTTPLPQSIMADAAAVCQVSAVRVQAGQASPVQDALAVEAPLQMTLNGRPWSITMRTPGEDPWLVRGLLYTEGLIAAGSPECLLTEIAAADREPATVAVTIPEIYLCERFFNRRTLAATAACGICGRLDMSDLGDERALAPPVQPLDPARLAPMMAAMRATQNAFASSGGCHGAALFDDTGTLLAASEDVGRHNAVDKVIGRLLAEGRLPTAHSLLVSGRLSFEIVHKAWRAGLLFLAAVSAPSSLAVTAAERLGICLLAFCRDGRATAYSHVEYLTLPGGPDGRSAAQ